MTLRRTAAALAAALAIGFSAASVHAARTPRAAPVAPDAQTQELAPPAAVREWRRAFESGPPRESLLSGVKDRIDKAMNVTIQRETEGIERQLGFLATVGATAPFVGLFGTVWGIMNSFSAIAARHDTTLAVVAPGIAEALFATAMGLLAAIPAVIFYNKFVNEIASYVG